MTTATHSLKDLAGAAKSDRNRAIDFYRALAMVAVAIGHWMATTASIGADGDLTAGNALEFAPGLSWMTWLFQVMPLFFVVGGFSSAMSLDSWNQAGNGARPQDWVVSRLRRMLTPTMTLATVWAVLLAGGYLIGQGSLIAVGAVSAAIPLWFLANYAIDTAIAPYVLPAFRKHPVALPAAGVTLFIALEIVRFLGVPFLPHVNWILGWLLFQVAGFAWRDGLLPTGRQLIAVAAGFWTLAVAAVTLGPWPVAMVHFPGLENSPTHPPSLALMLFGAAYSCTAVAAAPRISAWLARTPAAWKAVVGANGIAMSVYLWHFTAMIGAVAIFYPLGLLPTATVNSADWWIQKLPLMAAATALLALIVRFTAAQEQKALFAPRVAWRGGQLSMLVTAFVMSTALKQWAHGSLTEVIISLTVVLGLWHVAIKAPQATDDPSITA